jgi:hypothetical protein
MTSYGRFWPNDWKARIVLFRDWRRRKAGGGDPSYPGDPGDPGDPGTISLAEMAEAVISEAAPDQSELLGPVTASWRAGKVPGGSWGWIGGSVGSGVTTAVAVDIIYPLLTGSLAQVLGTAVIAGSQRWWRPKGRHARRIPDTRVRVDADQVMQVRSACVAHGRALGLTEAESKVLADALEGVLRREIAGSQAQP